MRFQKFTEFLNEGLSSVLYHYTHVEPALSILSKDRFSCSAAIGTVSDNELNKKKFFFLSLTRARNGQMGFARTHSSLCRIEIDGDKLGSRFKGEPVDYWQRPRDPKDPLWASMQPADKMHRLMADNEMEERIVTDKPYIEKAASYVKRVDVCEERKNITTAAADDIKKLREICKEKSIPFNLYTSRAEFDKRGKTGDLNTLEIDHSYDGDEPYVASAISPGSLEDLLKWVLVQNPDAAVDAFYKKHADSIDGGMSASELSERLKKYASKLSEDLRWAYGRDIYDHTASLESHISNVRGNDDPVLKDSFLLLFKAIRAAKCTGVKDFVEKMVKDRQPKLAETFHPVQNKINMEHIKSFGALNESLNPYAGFYDMANGNMETLLAILDENDIPYSYDENRNYLVCNVAQQFVVNHITEAGGMTMESAYVMDAIDDPNDCILLRATSSCPPGAME